MAYIGSTPTSQNFTSGTDYFSGTGSQTAYTLTRTVNSVNDIEVVINNVVQQPSTAYTLSGTTITFTSAPSSGTNNIYVRYLATNMQSFTVPANSITRSQLDSNLQAGFQGRNRIINGAMMIDQRNAGAAVTGVSSFPVDRFFMRSVNDGAYSAQQDTSAPSGFTNSIKITVTSTDSSMAATQSLSIRQRVEGYNIADLGWGTANAKTVTLSFWVRASVTGTYGGSICNGNEDRSHPFSFTINSVDTWEQKSVTVAGDTSGTWTKDNSTGLNVFVSVAAGTDRSGTAGAWNSNTNYSATGAINLMATSGATFYITGVQLEEGTTATSFEREAYSVTLQKCQRYYSVLVNGSDKVLCNAFAWSVNEFNGSVSFPVSMRTTPSLSFTSGAYYYFDKSGGTVTLPSPYFAGIFGVNLTSGTVYNSSMAGTMPAAGYSGTIRTNNAAAFIAVTAEL